MNLAAKEKHVLAYFQIYEYICQKIPYDKVSANTAS
jgi:hypothetical protein